MSDQLSNVSLKTGQLPCPLQDSTPVAAAIAETSCEMVLEKGVNAARHILHAINESPPKEEGSSKGTFLWRLVPTGIVSIDGESNGRTVQVFAEKPGKTNLSLEYEYDGKLATASIELVVDGVPKLVTVPATVELRYEVQRQAPPQSIELKNVGYGDVKVIELVPPDNTDFQVREIRDRTIKEGESLKVDVVFHPKTVGTKNASLVVRSSIGDLPIRLIGTPLNLARPSIEVVWGGTNKASDVRVKIGDVDFGKTPSSGLVSFPNGKSGLEGPQTIDLEFSDKVYTREPSSPTTFPEGFRGVHTVSLVKLAKPEVKVVWGKNDNWDGTDVPDVEVFLCKDNDRLLLGKTGISGTAAVAWGGKGIPLGDYVIDVELGDQKKNFSKKASLPLKLTDGYEGQTVFELVKNARPTIEVLWGGRGIKDVGVKLFSGGVERYDLKTTKDNGKVTFGDKDEGIAPGTYDVVLVYGPNKIQGDATPPTLTFEGGFTGTKVLRLAKRARPQIQVVWGRSNPIENVGVKLIKGITIYDFGPSNSQGFVSLPPGESVEPDIYSVGLTGYVKEEFEIDRTQLSMKLEEGFEGPKVVQIHKLARPKISVICDGQPVRQLTVNLKNEEANHDFGPLDDNGLVQLSEGKPSVIPGAYEALINYDPRFFLLETKNRTVPIESGFTGTRTINLTRLSRPQIKIAWGADRPAAGVAVTLKKDGQLLELGVTDDTGIVQLKDTEPGLLPGNYVVELKLDGTDYVLKSKSAITLNLEGKAPDPKTVSIAKLARPQINVVCGGQRVAGVGVKLRRGTEERPFGTTEGTAPLQLAPTAPALAAATYDVDLTYSGKLYASVLHPLTMQIAEGSEGVEPIEVQEVNVVTAKIEAEYKAVVIDRNLAQYQAGSETKLYADPTCVEITVEQTYNANPFKAGARFKCDPQNVSVFRDETCSTPLAGDLTESDLATGKVKLYLRGKTAGAFKASITLKDPSDRFIKPDKTAVEVTMHVVRFELDLHKQDTPELVKIKVDPDTDPVTNYYSNLHGTVLPPQKKMKEREKVEVGRLLHLQKGGHFSRAKLICGQLSGLPSELDAYQMVIDQPTTAGAVAVYDQEWGGTLQPFPLRIKFSDLKSDKVFWVEGETVSSALLDIRLEAGMDRPEDTSISIPKKTKHNAAWARLTVVEITEVKVDYTASGTRSAWDDANGKFYINFDTDPDGRKLHIGAQITPKLEDVVVHFMLAPDKGNGKAANWNIGLPGTAKWKDLPVKYKHADKTDRKDLLHLSARTNKDGYAKEELTLSRFGGDVFWPAAYLAEDPHLAKYVDGYAQLETKEPVFAAKSIRVMRKVYYQVTRPAATTMSDVTGFVNSQELVFIESEVVGTEKQMIRTDFVETPFRPEWQYDPTSVSATDKLCIGTHNITAATGLFIAATADNTPKFHVILCDEQFDAVDGSNNGYVTDVAQCVFGEVGPVGPAEFHLTISGIKDYQVAIFDRPLQGGPLVVNASWEAQELRGVNWVRTHTGLSPGNVRIVPGRSSNRSVEITPPAQCTGGGGCMCGGAATNLVLDPDHAVIVTLQVQAAIGPFAGWAPRNTVASVVRKDTDLAVQDTMAHEMGHLFKKVRHKSRVGIPNHPMMYQQRGGSGTHCAEGATWTPGGVPALNPVTPGELDAQGNGAGAYSNGTCILFGIASTVKREWCAHCAFEWIYSDLSRFN